MCAFWLFYSMVIVLKLISIFLFPVIDKKAALLKCRKVNDLIAQHPSKAEFDGLTTDYEQKRRSSTANKRKNSPQKTAKVVQALPEEPAPVQVCTPKAAKEAKRDLAPTFNSLEFMESATANGSGGLFLITPQKSLKNMTVPSSSVKKSTPNCSIKMLGRNFTVMDAVESSNKKKGIDTQVRKIAGTYCLMDLVYISVKNS
jgi:hypothetical protein